MGRRFVDARFIRQRMDEKDARLATAYLRSHELTRTALPKPQRGSMVLLRAHVKAEAVKLERRVKSLVRVRDFYTCRWPEPHVCRCGLENAHLVDASLGGAMSTSNLITLCGWIHRRGPDSIHGKQLRIEALTPAGADGPLSFWRQAEDGTYFVVAEEVAIGRVRRD